MGDNGAGKSTLDQGHRGISAAGFGHIYLNGEQVTIPSIRRRTAWHRIGVPGQGSATTWTWPSNLFLLGKEINQIGIRDDDSMNSCPFRVERP